MTNRADMPEFCGQIRSKWIWRGHSLAVAYFPVLCRGLDPGLPPRGGGGVGAVRVLDRLSAVSRFASEYFSRATRGWDEAEAEAKR
jgi:hypothetical protein